MQLLPILGLVWSPSSWEFLSPTHRACNIIFPVTTPRPVVLISIAQDGRSPISFVCADLTIYRKRWEACNVFWSLLPRSNQLSSYHMSPGWTRTVLIMLRIYY